MKTFKFGLNLVMAFVMSLGLWACSDDEPAKDNPGVEGSEVTAAFGDDYWIVTDTKVVASDGKEYSDELEANLELPVGVAPMLGLRLDDTELRLFTNVATKNCYMDLPILKVDKMTMYLENNCYDYIKLESVDTESIVVSYWEGLFSAYDKNNEGKMEYLGVAEGAYMKSALRKATPEEIEQMKQSIYIMGAYH